MYTQELLDQIKKELKLTDTKIAEKINISKEYLAFSLKNNKRLDTDAEHLLCKLAKVDPLALSLSRGELPTEYIDTIIKNADAFATLLRGLNENQNSQSIKKMDSIKPSVETPLGKLFNMDCNDFLNGLESRSVDCVFADPPFNLGKNYKNGKSDSIESDEYLTWCKSWLLECIRILKDGGALFLYNLPEWNVHLASFLSQYLKFKHWIAISLPTGLPIPKRLGAAHYSLLYFIKGDQPKHFSAPRVPIDTCRHCGGEIKDYGGYRNKMNASGVNITDIWTDIPLIRHQKYKTRGFANELSLKLIDRILDISTKEGDLIVDPFGGSGTTYIVSELKNRRWIGSEIGPCDITSDRFSNIEKEKENLSWYCRNKNVLFTKEAISLRIHNGYGFKGYNIDVKTD